MSANGGKSQDNYELIRDFLAHFGGDTKRAVDAIRIYARSKQSSQHIRPAATPNTPVLLSVRNLEKTYKIRRQKIEVLRGVDLDIHEGEFVAITGTSGSGKSTLLQLMGGLDKPTSGNVTFGDTDLSRLSDAKLSTFRGQTIGFVFQFFYLQPFLHLQRNIEVPGMFARLRDRTARSAKLAEQVGLEDRKRHFPRELSGGQMQRAAIARALFNNPKIILADEPTGNLDSKNSEAIVELFESIRREFGTAIVIVTHDPSIARRADREIAIRDGKVVV